MVGLKALLLNQPASYQRKADYEIGKPLGKGIDGVVRQAVIVKGFGQFPKKHVAMKTVLKKGKKPDELERYRKRLNHLKTLSHPHIAELHDWFESRREFFAVYELATCGDLFEMIVSQGHFSELDAQATLKALLEAVDFLHQRRIVHRDIKPENIFVRSTEPGDIALGDFEASEQLWDEEDTLTGIAGTIGYASPEAIIGGPHNRSTDIWSIGIVAYALLAGRLPFGSNQPDEILTEMRDLAVTRQYDWPPFPDSLFSEVSDIAKDFILSCVEEYPADRPTSTQSLRHPWVKFVTVPSSFRQDDSQPELIITKPKADSRRASAALSRYATTGSTAPCSISVVQVQGGKVQAPKVAEQHTKNNATHHRRHHQHHPHRNRSREERTSDDSDPTRARRSHTRRRRKTAGNEIPYFAGMML